MAVGLSALERGLIDEVGLVSALPRFARLEPAGWSDFVVGGHEIRDVALADEAMRLATESRAIEPELCRQCREELDAIDRRIRPGTIHNVGPTIAEFAGRRRSPGGNAPRGGRAARAAIWPSSPGPKRLEHVVVVNVASTEPPVDADRAAGRAGPSWSRCWTTRGCPLPASSLYAIAALDSGCSYINFTPSLGSPPPAIDELARLRGTRHMGCDGKTGETLMKSVLAPMFADRNLRGDELGRPQHLRQPGRQGARRPGQQAGQGRQQGPPARAKSSATRRRRSSRSSTSRAWATGRRPGTTFIFADSWARR